MLDNKIHTMKTAVSTATIVQPTGVPYTIATPKPVIEPMTDNDTDKTIKPLKLFDSRIADNVGSTISADTSNAPTRCVARTITVSVKSTVSTLYFFVLSLVAYEKSSSKVVAYILL